MNNAKRLLGVLFVGLASTALFIACGDSADSCLLDTDCEAGFVCEQEICVQTCTTRAECPSGSDCLQRANGTELICVEVPGLNNNNNTNNNNTTPNNVNNNTSPLYHVLITDTTTGAGCTSTSGGQPDPGSDIAVVVLEDLEGTILGYGEAIEWFEGSEPEGNGFVDVYGNLDGSPPSFGDRCPEDFNAETVASLGCGGQVLVRFLDYTGKPLSLNESQQIRVLEYGQNCGGNADDSFRISLCTDPVSAELDGSLTSCTVVLGAGSGLVIGEVRIP